MGLCEESYAHLSNVEDVKFVVLVDWELCRSGGCKHVVVRMLVVVEEGFPDNVYSETVS